MKQFEEIYTTHAKMIYKYLLSISLNEQIAEDLLQETFYKGIKGIRKFHGECKIEVWLCKIARNCYYDYLRKEKKYLLTDDMTKYELRYEDNSIIEREGYVELLKILDQLSEVYREVFMLKHYGELSLKEIAEMMGKSESWARVSYFRARQQLRRQVDEKRM